MNRVSWFAFRHPFVTAVGAVAVMLGAARVYGSPTSWGVVGAVLVAIGVLVMWWPKHGVLTRDVRDWLDDDDPRVVKPREPGDP